jgi:hypothetical protein
VLAAFIRKEVDMKTPDGRRDEVESVEPGSAVKGVPHQASAPRLMNQMSNAEFYIKGPDEYRPSHGFETVSSFYGTKKLMETKNLAKEKIPTRNEMSKSLYSGLKTEFKLANLPQNYLPTAAIRTGGFLPVKELA